jgi:uncharacterized membrane protein YedE/YeeE
MLLILVLLSAFWVGMAISRCSTCAVTASREILLHRRGTMLLNFVIAAGVAGAVTLPLHWWLGPAAHLSAEVPISGALLLGAVLIGLGAVINDACLLGTIARIGQGEVRFLAVPVGLALGFAMADSQALLAPGPARPNLHASPMWPGALIVADFVLLAGWAWHRRGRSGGTAGSAAQWPRAMMLAMGLCGALLFTLEPHWSYSDALVSIVRRGEMQMRSDSRALAPALALLGGAVLSGLFTRSFVLQPPRAGAIARSLIGGATMAFGGMLIPGGNDSLLLAAIPSGTVSGLAAYLVMSVTVLALLHGGELYRRRALQRRPARA